jgi:ribose transport system permease protein
MSAARGSVGPRLRRVALRQSYAFALLLLVVAIAINYYLQPNFFQPGILSGNLLLFVPLMLVAVGQTAVVIGGGIDLSLGAIVSMANVIFVSLMSQEPSASRILLALAAGFLAVHSCRTMWCVLLPPPGVKSGLGSLLLVSTRV